MSSTNVTSGSTSPATPRPPSTSWQKPCVVAIVALSKSASAAARFARRCSTSSGVPVASSAVTASPGASPAWRARQPALGRDEPLAHAVAQLAGRHPREGDEQQVLEPDALGDVAGRERGDRVRLAGAGAGLEDGHAGRQRAADVEAAHRISVRSCATRPPHSRFASWPKRVCSPGSQRSSSRGVLGEQLGEAAHAAEREHVVGLLVLLVEAPLRLPRLARGLLAALDVGRAGLGRERQRLAQAAAMEVEHDRELRARLAGLDRGEVRELHAALGRARRAPDQHRLEAALGMRGGQRQPAHPQRDPVARVHARERDRAQHVAVHAGHRPAEPSGADVDRARLAGQRGAGRRSPRRSGAAAR